MAAGKGVRRIIFMDLKRLPYQFTVCKLNSAADLVSDKEFWFAARTDEEISLVCKTSDCPSETLERDDGWRGFRIEGVLDFSLIGILSKISAILAENRIGIFAVSTYNTDYILVKEVNFGKAMQVLEKQGYNII